MDYLTKGYSVNCESGKAEITMYGEIVENVPVDWWTGEKLEGNFIVQDEFLEDIEKAVSSGANEIVLRMNSCGGDAGVSILIHNRLREYAKKGKKICCVVDGVAMSGGSLIMCAADEVTVNPSSLVMIHKAWGTVFGGYNADELRAMAKTRDAWDEAQVSIYKRKCNLSETVISHMMSETTYMVGKEAVEKGFADILAEEEGMPVAASADRRSVFVSGRRIALPMGVKAPENIPIAQSEEISEQNIKTDKGETTMAKNLEELRVENAELASAVESEIRASAEAEKLNALEEAKVAERKRLSDIDEIACLYDNETVREAKYGESACTAQEMAFRAAQKQAKQGSQFMTEMQKDVEESGVNNVESVPAEEDGAETPEKKMAEARDSISALLGKK